MSTLSMSDFEVVSFLGKGTTGSVYKVRRRADGALLVVKAIMLTGYSEVQRREIINEVTVMSRASHPNVIAYEGSFVERDTLHIVMELLPGGDLAQEIESRAAQTLAAGGGSDAAPDTALARRSAGRYGGVDGACLAARMASYSGGST